VRLLALDVPQRDVYRRQRCHEDRAAAPVALPVDQMPQVFDALRIAPDEQVRDMTDRLRDDRLAAVERAFPDAVETRRVREYLDEDVVAARAGDNDLDFGDFHGACFLPLPSPPLRKGREPQNGSSSS